MISTSHHDEGPRPAAPRISVVVPALNEARNLEVLLPELAGAVGCHEVVVVDGGSVDDTVAAARRVLPSVRVVHQVRRGKGNALAAGFAKVTGDVVVVLDADVSADPAEIPRFVQALVDGADVARGTRFARGGAPAPTTARARGRRALTVVFNALFDCAVTDLGYGYHAFWADMVDVLDLPDHRVMAGDADRLLWGDGFEVEAVLACRFAAAGAVVAEVGSVERPRAFGSSHLHAVRDGLRMLRALLAERRRLCASARGTTRVARPPADTTTSWDLVA